MDLIVIIVNEHKSRKLIKTYLREHGLEGFVMMDSSGTSYITESFQQYKSMNELPFDAMPKNSNRGKTLFVLNNKDESTESYIEGISELFQMSKGRNYPGIVFSIPVSNVFDLESVMNLI